MGSNTKRLHIILRRLLPLPVFGLVWLLTQLNLSPLISLELFFYAVVNFALLFAFRRFPLNSSQLLLVAVTIDLFAVGWLLATAGFHTVLFVIQGISALRSWRYRSVSLWPALIPILIGFLFVFDHPIALSTPTLFQLGQVVELGSFLFSVGFIAAIIMFGNHRNQVARELQTRYDQARREHKQQFATLEAINNDLRDRLRRMEALGESLRAVNSSLSLDEVLRLILDSLTNMLGVQRIDDAALTLINQANLEHRMLRDHAQATAWATTIAQAVIASGRTVLLDSHEIMHCPEWAALAKAQFRTALSVPLFDPDQPDVVRGALSVVSHREEAFSPAEERHLTSFGNQAIIAIRNADLHVQLRQQQAMLSAVLNDMAEGLIVFDEQGTVYLENAIARQIKAHSANHNGLLAAQLAEIATHLHRHGEDIKREIVDGEGESARYYQIHGTLVKATPNTRLAVLLLQDITERKTQEQQRREFIAKVVHELRGPIHTAQGFLNIVLKESDNVGKLTEQQRDFLREVDRSTRRLAKRITELIEVNRSESVPLRLDKKRANVIDVIIATCTQQQHQAREREITLIYEVPEYLPDIVIDEDRIGQVLTNLIENAIKATPAGGKIIVSAELHEQGILVHVTDTGTGIPSEQIEHVFKPHYSLNHRLPSRQLHAGLGLGLPICKQFVEAHGGKIWIAYSEVGKGTRFTFSLPLSLTESTSG